MKYQDYTMNELKLARESLAGRVHRFNAYIDSLRLNMSTPTGRNAIELQIRLEKIEALYEEFDEVVTRLEKMPLQQDLRSDFEEKYFKSIAAAKDALERGKKK